MDKKKEPATQLVELFELGKVEDAIGLVNSLTGREEVNRLATVLVGWLVESRGPDKDRARFAIARLQMDQIPRIKAQLLLAKKTKTQAEGKVDARMLRMMVEQLARDFVLEPSVAAEVARLTANLGELPTAAPIKPKRGRKKDLEEDSEP